MTKNTTGLALVMTNAQAKAAALARFDRAAKTAHTTLGPSELKNVAFMMELQIKAVKDRGQGWHDREQAEERNSQLAQA